ncbi:MAG: aminopeptidase P family protein [Alistipes sp.]|jgi:Xaa-Pro aminopeptidase|nr:aminopeptidase P family protein [Alistipes sp.]
MFSKETYTQRRAELARKMQGGEQGLVLLPGNAESPANYTNNAYRFRQDSTFLYYFGHSLPGLAGVVDIDTGETTLFGDDFSVEDIIWMGPQPSVAELGARVGVASTKPLSALAEVVAGAMARGRRGHILPPYRAETKTMLAELFGGAGAGVGAVPAASDELAKAVVDMRDKKSAEEIALIEEACRTGYEMHTLAMRMCRPGAKEQDIAGAIEGLAIQKGWGGSFHSIVSQHGETLHNHSHDGILDSGRMLLVDAGAEAVSNYCSDFTRTMPVSGKFTARQRDIYEIVLAANNRAFEISAPGVRYVDVHLASSRVIVEGLHSLGLVRGSIDAAVDAGVHSLFMPHGLGHQMGLDVHDMENIGERFVGYDDETPRSTHPSVSRCRMGRRLQPGMVVTVEPGIYFVPALVAKWRAEGTCAEFVNFSKVEEYLDFGGIRLEDDMLVTETGNRLLGLADDGATPRRIPITVAEIEEAMRG